MPAPQLEPQTPAGMPAPPDNRDSLEQGSSIKISLLSAFYFPERALAFGDVSSLHRLA
jgi:hypothetical protein